MIILEVVYVKLISKLGLYAEEEQIKAVEYCEVWTLLAKAHLISKFHPISKFQGWMQLKKVGDSCPEQSALGLGTAFFMPWPTRWGSTILC